MPLRTLGVGRFDALPVFWLLGQRGANSKTDLLIGRFFCLVKEVTGCPVIASEAKQSHQ